MMRTTFALFAALVTQPLAALQAQETQPQIPEIMAMATGESRAAPDRATILFTVDTRAATAAQAGEQNAARQTAVINALRQAGVAADAVQTVSYTISPEYQWDEPRRTQRIVGYVARNVIRLEVRELARIGPLIDVALRGGANEVSSLQFYSSRRDELRQEAVVLAVTRACREASAIARAAGGTLGPLMQANTSDGYMPPPAPPMPMMRQEAAAADTPITPGDLEIRVNVSTRWRFVPAGVAPPPGAPGC
jgi:uncharacterized protein